MQIYIFNSTSESWEGLWLPENKQVPNTQENVLNFLLMCYLIAFLQVILKEDSVHRLRGLGIFYILAMKAATRTRTACILSVICFD